MTARTLAGSRGAAGRADLLRVIAAGEPKRLTLDLDETGWFGYILSTESKPQGTAPAPGPMATPVPPTGPAAEAGQPLTMPMVPAIVRREVRSPPDPDTNQPASTDAFTTPLDEADAQPRSAHRLGEAVDLVPHARLIPALRRMLDVERWGRLDTERLARSLARGRLPRHLPRRRHRRWPPDLVVLLDFSPRLWPYRRDMHRLAERLVKDLGAGGVRIRLANHGPFGPWRDWQAVRRAPVWAAPADLPWTPPAPGTPVLIVGDLGLLLGPRSAEAGDWARFVEGVRRAGARPVTLMPLGAGQVGAPLPPDLPILRWSPDARPHPTTARGTAEPVPEGLDALLTLAAVIRRIDPPLLRALRRLLPDLAGHAGVEGALWCHEEVEAGWTAALRPLAAERYLKRFAALPPELQAAIDQVRERHHRHLRAVVGHEETLVWEAHARKDAVADSPGAAQRAREAQAFLEKLVASVTKTDAARAADWRLVAEGIMARADETMWTRHAAPLDRLAEAQRRHRGTIPRHADMGRLSALSGQAGGPRSAWLIQDAATGEVRVQAEPAGPRQRGLGAPLTVDAVGLRVLVGDAAVGRQVPADRLPAGLGRPAAGAALHVDTVRERVTIAPVARPYGVASWSCGREGLAVRAPAFGDWQAAWGEADLQILPPGAEAATGRLTAPPLAHPDLGGAVRVGIDAAFGVFADLAIETGHGSARQRLRWIPPGRFLMGSPEDEPGRFDWEGPQHEVTLANGFWLFDTPCTQALWQAVMGENPSRFRSPDRPVETVSWDDVQTFLERINGLVPGLGLSLPSEAHWEYACRAGTQTALYSGPIEILGQNNAPALDPIAWYGGNSGVGFDLAEGEDASAWPEKQHPHTKAGTRIVGLKAPNRWGLYDMLGNVLEWCADPWHDSYDGAPQDGSAWLRPEAPSGASRVIRGGSWNDRARYVRSAFRHGSGPGRRVDSLGFRCARVQGTGAEPRSGAAEPGGVGLDGPAERPSAPAPTGGAAPQAPESGIPRRRRPRR